VSAYPRTFAGVSVTIVFGTEPIVSPNVSPNHSAIFPLYSLLIPIAENGLLVACTAISNPFPRFFPAEAVTAGIFASPALTASLKG